MLKFLQCVDNFGKFSWSLFSLLQPLWISSFTCHCCAILSSLQDNHRRPSIIEKSTPNSDAPRLSRATGVYEWSKKRWLWYCLLIALCETNGTFRKRKSSNTFHKRKYSNKSLVALFTISQTRRSLAPILSTAKLDADLLYIIRIDMIEKRFTWFTL